MTRLCCDIKYLNCCVLWRCQRTCKIFKLKKPKEKGGCLLRYINDMLVVDQLHLQCKVRVAHDTNFIHISKRNDRRYHAMFILGDLFVKS